MSLVSNLESQGLAADLRSVAELQPKPLLPLITLMTLIKNHWATNQRECTRIKNGRRNSAKLAQKTKKFETSTANRLGFLHLLRTHQHVAKLKIGQALHSITEIRNY